MPDDRSEAFMLTLQRAIQHVRWRGLPEAMATSTDDVATHEGVLELPGLGRVKAYRLASGEAVFDLEEVLRLLGLEEEP